MRWSRSSGTEPQKTHRARHHRSPTKDSLELQKEPEGVFALAQRQEVAESPGNDPDDEESHRHPLAIAAGDRSTLVLVLAYTGLRWGGAIGLRATDVDFDRRRLNVTVNAVEIANVITVGTPETHMRRSVPFPALLSPALRERCDGKAGDELVFATRQGTHERRWHNDHGWFPSAVKKAGIPPMTPHGLRHTAASLAVSAGANVKAVQRMLGHASAAMTLDVYADLFEDDLDVVAGRLDNGLAQTVVGRMWAEHAAANEENPRFRGVPREEGAK